MALLDVLSRVVEGSGAAAIILRAGWPESDTSLRQPIRIHSCRQRRGQPDAQNAHRQRMAAARRRTPLLASRSTRSRPISSTRWICVLPNGDVL
jgi:hypothetical protein